MLLIGRHAEERQLAHEHFLAFVVFFLVLILLVCKLVEQRHPFLFCVALCHFAAIFVMAVNTLDLVAREVIEVLLLVLAVIRLGLRYPCS